MALIQSLIAHSPVEGKAQQLLRLIASPVVRELHAFPLVLYPSFLYLPNNITDSHLALHDWKLKWSRVGSALDSGTCENGINGIRI